jgi:hypothetical protein
VTILKSGGTEYLGQITAQEMATREGPEYRIKTNADSSLLLAKFTSESNFVDRVRLHFVQGHGVLLGRVEQGKILPTSGADVFDDATLRPANAEVIALHLSPSGTGLDIGYALSAETGKARVALELKGFRRHTFMCGQSRSGKTFALGVILEQLLLSKGSPRVIILDPNSDFIYLNRLRTKEDYDKVCHAPRPAKEYSDIVTEYQKIAPAIRVLRPDSGLRIRLSDLNRQEQGAVLQLHPIRDLQAFNAFSKVIEGLGNELYSWQFLNDRLTRDFSASTMDLAMRIQNLRVTDWEVWCKTMEPSIAQALNSDDWRCMVIDIGTLKAMDQRAVAALAVLNHLWTSKNPKSPMLLVLDEAHNICPHEPANQMEEIATDYLVRIAAEGLKYGLRLLLASQRPAKIHANVITQCENLVLMRMNSQTDLDSLTRIFSQAPSTLIAQSRYFTQGEALISGEIVRNPTFAKFEGRLTLEGGGDAPIAPPAHAV